jgi:hypothetical protein
MARHARGARRKVTIYVGKVEELCPELSPDLFDACLCDPPYGLKFMGKKWDYQVPLSSTWAEVLRVLKPGAALVAFSATKTYHRATAAIEDGGFEVRDMLSWIYGQGMPKGLAVSKAIDGEAGAEREDRGDERHVHLSAYVSTTESIGMGAFLTAPATELAKECEGYGTELKPSCEPACLARKPLEGGVVENVTKWGCGVLAIDDCRIAATSRKLIATIGKGVDRSMNAYGADLRICKGAGTTNDGRYPANVVFGHSPGCELVGTTTIKAAPSWADGKARSGKTRASSFTSSGHDSPVVHAGADGAETIERWDCVAGCSVRMLEMQKFGASRFFYCAKASKHERGPGNDHETVKPVVLCRYFATLIKPPKPTRILVPFSGSGSEIIGCLVAGWPEVVGIEMDEHHAEFAAKRIRAGFKDVDVEVRQAPTNR